MVWVDAVEDGEQNSQKVHELRKEAGLDLLKADVLMTDGALSKGSAEYA